MYFRHLDYHHEPVLLKESIENLITDKNGIYIDATFGGGGHSYTILKKLNKRGILISLDKDKESIERNIIKDKRLHLFHSNFIHIRNILNQNNIKKVSGILADLGVSSLQIENPNRGFSNQLNCPLDMRMNQESSLSAKNVINECSGKELFHIFREYGDFKNAQKIVKKVLKKRFQKKIDNTFDLSNLFFVQGSFKKRKRFISRLFQSIRIKVNDEINVLKDFLLESSKVIRPGGRIAIISYHSIEDRVVKHFFKKGILINKINCETLPFRMIHKKVIKPSIQEIIKNTRSRSARLRIAEKI
ncbi:16S rRNA (cytosine(1402)-N(4))-methyltransferase RsmH [Blattabacterium cuenoti]|uniref:16S rRNA (cytosine(1402)-N(4))-methyltransferase RsmH n=1 Tax=Blattabacterium cuenoti TaxID=1653831 RepID=UPI00163C2A5F|nr:16S rRNA (cytosine(1402)-N(4))-methyltransferase RsmH [Blattabacterium cuenoti]